MQASSPWRCSGSIENSPGRSVRHARVPAHVAVAGRASNSGWPSDGQRRSPVLHDPAAPAAAAARMQRPAPPTATTGRRVVVVDEATHTVENGTRAGTHSCSARSTHPTPSCINLSRGTADLACAISDPAARSNARLNRAQPRPIHAVCDAAAAESAPNFAPEKSSAPARAAAGLVFPQADPKRVERRISSSASTPAACTARLFNALRFWAGGKLPATP